MLSVRKTEYKRLYKNGYGLQKYKNEMALVYLDILSC